MTQIDSMVTITGGEYEAMRAEIDRLKAEVEKMTKAQSTLIEARDQMEACWKREHQGSERLRAALEINACACSSSCERERGDLCPHWEARAVLTQQGGER